MTGYLPHDANLARLDDMRARADEHRRAHRRTAPAALPASHSIAIRCATEADRITVENLAALNGARPLSGDLLIAEVCDQPRAAIHVASGVAVADPFRPTADVVELLRLRASRLRDPIGSVGRPGLRARLRSAYRAA
jgi:hypothetical protein